MSAAAYQCFLVLRAFATRQTNIERLPASSSKQRPLAATLQLATWVRNLLVLTRCTQHQACCLQQAIAAQKAFVQEDMLVGHTSAYATALPAQMQRTNLIFMAISALSMATPSTVPDNIAAVAACKSTDCPSDARQTKLNRLADQGCVLSAKITCVVLSDIKSKCNTT